MRPTENGSTCSDSKPGAGPRTARRVGSGRQVDVAGASKTVTRPAGEPAREGGLRAPRAPTRRPRTALRGDSRDARLLRERLHEGSAEPRKRAPPNASQGASIQDVAGNRTPAYSDLPEERIGFRCTRREANGSHRSSLPVDRPVKPVVAERPASISETRERERRRTIRGSESVLDVVGRFPRDGCRCRERATRATRHKTQASPGLADPRLAMARSNEHERSTCGMGQPTESRPKSWSVRPRPGRRSGRGW